MRIDYQPLSVENVRDIRRYYIEVADNALALKVIKMIRTEISALSEQPNRAPAYDLAPNVRRLVVYNGIYLVFYRVTKVIEILHIRRAEREPATANELEKIKIK